MRARSPWAASRLHEFLQISQVLDPASCWPLRYPHNPVGPRGVPYRNHRSLQNRAVCKNQCDLETVTIGSVSCLSVLAGGKGLGSALKPVRSRCRDATDLAPGILSSAVVLKKASSARHRRAPLRLPRPGIQEGARGPGATVSVAIFFYRRHGSHYFLVT